MMRAEAVPRSFPPAHPSVPEHDEAAYIWERLALGFVHPCKVAIVKALRCKRRPLSAEELSAATRNPGYGIPTIWYHLTRLAEAEILERSDGDERRHKLHQQRFYFPAGG